MDSITPEIIAEVQFYPTSEGGRKSHLPQSKFGCILEVDGHSFDCALLLQNREKICPGDKVTGVAIKLLFPDLLVKYLKPGQKFYLKEIGRIAEGRIEQLLTSGIR